MDTPRAAKIVTFYSYKGGTGRSMALANVGWILASAGRRVLMIDWDLEAPGLHRYFHPFMDDPSLENSTGVIDFLLEFVGAAVSGGDEPRGNDWYMPYSNILAHALPIAWQFPNDGVLDFVPAGRQDSGYATRVNSFGWRSFYEKLGGGVWLEVVKRKVRERYDYILIDSRTGVSDTSGICTVQMPDELVVCFTLNQQSVRGASAVAASAFAQRRTPQGASGLKIWPIPMRVEFAEQKRLEMVRAQARTRFSNLVSHLTPEEEDEYWGRIEVAYHPYYAYEEVLAVFGDRPRQTRSLYSSLETVAAYLAGAEAGSLRSLTPLGEDERSAGLARFTSRPASAYVDELKLIGQEYESVRRRMVAGDQRTYIMTALVSRAQLLAGRQEAARVAEQLFKLGTEGARVIGLALARLEPQRGHIEMALDGISSLRSHFEQYHALVLAQQLGPLLDPTARHMLATALSEQIGRTITDEDRSRIALARDMLKELQHGELHGLWKQPAGSETSVPLAGVKVQCVSVTASAPSVHYDDVAEQHGPWLVSRRQHTVQVPRAYRLGAHLVTNEVFFEFMKAGGYEREELWPGKPWYLSRFVTADGTSRGPASWPGGDAYPAGHAQHPVSGISFVEAQAFVAWCNQASPVAGWRWDLPTEDMWEYAARTEARLLYPWGDVFSASRCNSRESGLGGTSQVSRFPEGVSRDGCYDMAGNLWEFVQAPDSEQDKCVLRGGSFKNDRFELRCYLRLFGVSRVHRPDDFGMRLALLEAAPSVR